MKAITMKRWIGILLLVSLALSCQDDLPVYEDVNRVYFYYVTATDQPQMVTDNIKVNLGYDNPIKDDTVVYIPVRLLGRVSNVNRPITAEVIRAESSAVPGEDIEFLPSYIAAGGSIGVLGVRLITTEKLSTQTLTASIRLTPNESFYVDMSTMYVPLDGTSAFAGLEYHIAFDAKGDVPNLWADAKPLQDYFREWSKVKEELLYELFGFTRDFLMYDAAATLAAGKTAADVANERIPGPIAMGMCTKINRYLRDYETEHGYKLVDENGREVIVAMAGTY